MKKDKTTPKFAWHVHHDILVEPLTEDFGVRVEFIKEHKPKEEQELRLRLFKKVKSTLPKALVDAGKAHLEARKAFVEAREAHNETGKDETVRSYLETGRA